MSLGGMIAKSPRRLPDNVTVKFLHGPTNHIELPRNFFPVSLAKLRGTSLEEIDSDCPETNILGNGLEIHTNEVFEEFGIPDGSERSRLLSSYNGDHHYGSRLVKVAARIAREIDFRGSYDLTPQNWQHLFLSLTRLIHLNDEGTARLIVAEGLRHIDDAAKQIRGYTTVQLDDVMILVPRKYSAQITIEKSARDITLHDMDGMMQLRGYERQSYHGTTIYVLMNKTHTKIN